MFNKILDRYFQKPKEKEADNPSKDLLDKYLSAKKDISYLESKWEDYILRFLEVEFDDYKREIDDNYPDLVYKTTNWKISESGYDYITFTKSQEENEISITSKYSFYDGKWELKYAQASFKYKPGQFFRALSAPLSLNNEKFKDIIFNYFIYLKVKEVEIEKESKKQSFQKMIDIIGKDVKRDSLIEQILS